MQNFALIFVEYPKCSTCRKAKQYLQSKSVTFEDRHIVDETPTVEELKQWMKNAHFPLRKLFNTSGQVYRELQLKEKLDTLSEEEQYALLASNGMLIKRPLLISEHHFLAGFQEQAWNDVIESIKK